MTLELLIASLVCVLWVLKTRVGLNLGLTSVLLVMLLLFHGPAYWYYTRSWGPGTDFFERILAAAPDADVIGTLDVALSLTLLFACAGILFADALAGTTSRSWFRAVERWGQTPLDARRSERKRVVAWTLLIATILLVPFLLIDGQLSKVHEYVTADVSEVDKIILRREMGGSSSYLYNLLLSNAVAFLAFALLALQFTRHRGSLPWAVAFLVLVLVGKAATLSKAPPAIFALQCLEIPVLARRLAISRRALLLLAAAALVLFALMAWIANPSGDQLPLILDFLFYRIFMIANESLLEYFAAIPHVLPHTWGSQFSWVASLLQQEPSLPNFWLVAEVHRGFIGSTTTAMFMADAWADFSWLGVMAAGFVAGALVRWTDRAIVMRRGKSVAAIAGLALGHYGLFIAMSTSLQTAMVTGGLLLLLPLMWLISSFNRGSARRRVALPPVANAPVLP